ncbi:hypothetical protein PR202_gb17097 [Eleusine coracana subsp. coracana]|uniref:Uncharacterized protein n=1 Tax=Eleusine coracana subsp. coracana TaxID=191504 RepID=A0AAV5F229_ELECO|nr:hypothetical protein PR202_gb17097 [Eleusine coracana subsp. coracana]
MPPPDLPPLPELHPTTRELPPLPDSDQRRRPGAATTRRDLVAPFPAAVGHRQAFAPPRSMTSAMDAAAIAGESPSPPTKPGNRGPPRGAPPKKRKKATAATQQHPALATRTPAALSFPNTGNDAAMADNLEVLDEMPERYFFSVFVSFLYNLINWNVLGSTLVSEM